MTNNDIRRPKSSEAHIDFEKIPEITYWSKKWEVSPRQLIEAYNATKSNSVKRIENYLREKGFAL